MYNPENNRGGASMVAPSPAGAPPSLGAIQQQLSELPPLKKKRGRPTKAEMEARRERQRLELLAAQRIHGGDLPADLQDLQDPAEQARQKQEQDQQVQQQIREQENEQAHDSGQVHEEIEEDESEEGGPDSPDEED
jgi:ATP/maltotriose-dependent transcriptional regulator MalT